MMIPAFIRNKFVGVQQPLGRWILRHILESIVLAPLLIFVIPSLKIRKKEVLLIGESPVISRFIAPLDPEIRRRIVQGSLSRAIVLNLSVDANSQVRKMYDQIVKIYGNERRIRRRLIWWASRLGVGYRLLIEDKSDVIWQGTPAQHGFSRHENIQGRKFLSDVGIQSGDPFICYAVRNESYYLRLVEKGVTVKPRSVRNPNEEVYLKAFSGLIKNGLPVIRMGKDVEDASDIKKFPDVIDYARNFRTDFLDVFLLSNCKFLLVGNTGLFWVRAMFNKVTLHCDLYDIRHQVLTHDVMTFQKVLFKDENRIATVSEMLKMRSEYSDERHQARLGVELVKNTADEIFAACEEMNARIDGTWETTVEDEKLQQRYLDLVIKYSDQPTWRGGGRVGTQFLRDNQDLLK